MKIARSNNVERFKKLGQSTDNVSDATLIRRIFTTANESVSNILD